MTFLTTDDNRLTKSALQQKKRIPSNQSNFINESVGFPLLTLKCGFLKGKWTLYQSVAWVLQTFNGVDPPEGLAVNDEDGVVSTLDPEVGLESFFFTISVSFNNLKYRNQFQFSNFKVWWFEFGCFQFSSFRLTSEMEVSWIMFPTKVSSSFLAVYVIP